MGGQHVCDSFSYIYKETGGDAAGAHTGPTQPSPPAVPTVQECMAPNGGLRHSCTRICSDRDQHDEGPKWGPITSWYLGRMVLEPCHDGLAVGPWAPSLPSRHGSSNSS